MSAPSPAVHPVLGALAVVEGALKDVADVNPTFMDTDTKRLALEGLVAAEARLVELRLRVMATASDVAEDSAARDLGTWLVAHTHADFRAARADLRLAHALDRRWERVRAAMAAGEVSPAQAGVVVKALEDLPEDLPTDLPGDTAADTLAEAEVMLVDLCRRLTPAQLTKAGRRILELVAPEIAEATLVRQLEAEEATARRKTRLTFRPNGDGTTRISAVVPDACAVRLKTYLDAFTSPRRRESRGEGPYPRILGTAFCALLERIGPATLPMHGGRATSVVVTISLDSLRQELGIGGMVGGQAISATEVRRLACTAGIIPAVLGARGEILDLGRAQRLFSAAQHTALVLRDRTCRAEGCGIPGTWAEAHHWIPWILGGRTDLANGLLLCSHHHHRVHDPRFTADRLPNGDVRFTRRT